MATIKNFEDLEIWQKARELCKLVNMYMSKEKFSKDFDLKSQMRILSGSTMDNIAEGFERGGNAEFIYFLGISKGSSGEVRSQLYRALDFEYINKEEFQIACDEAKTLSKMINAFMNYLIKSSKKGFKFNKNQPRTSDLEPRTDKNN